MKYEFSRIDEGIEKDIVINEVKGIKLQKPIAIEVNGVNHYARNSELNLGSDIIKKMILEK